jgi:tRNA(fMet)-specific endonuclease VapC
VLALDPADKVVTTIITYEEQTRGWLAYAGKSRDLPHQIKAYARLKSHLAMYGRIEVVDFTLRRRGCSLAWSAASCASALRM